MKVFLDTNVLVSALTTRGLCTELFEAVLQAHDLLISESVIVELERILPEKMGQPKTITKNFVALLRTEAQLVSGTAPFPSLPDADDEPIVASAIAGQAQVFVTGDKALLELQRVEHLAMISPRQFWEMCITNRYL
ncbi:MAG: putative toxin-antitoxin system toxin component, PIN family [Gammaproteobacteria bacterium]|nr:putative toxin-antitoxin system toxin component, PIN family [Gammaproteobacteria bacterium]